MAQALLLLCMIAALGACGKKALHVSPPDSVVDDTYPRTYPDPKTDPDPTATPPTNAAPTDIKPAQ